MGKIRRQDAEMMLKNNQISQETYDKMDANGQIAKQKGESERIMKTGSNTWVTPMFYYKGLKDSKRSKQMIELRDKVNQLIAKYTISKSEKSEVNK